MIENHGHAEQRGASGTDSQYTGEANRIDGMIAHLSWALHLSSEQAEVARRVVASWSEGEGEYAFARCESPAEKLFLVGAAMTDNVELRCGSDPERVDEETYGYDMWRTDSHIGYLEETLIDSQVEVGKYRVDFLLSNDMYVDKEERPLPLSRVAVEIDGHEWHERNKEQAAADRSRDIELLLSHKIPTIRFTGSQVYSDPVACFRKAVEVLESFVSLLATHSNALMDAYWAGRAAEQEAKGLAESANSILNESEECAQ